ncbi:MAG: MBOAT family protein, partial [Lachnospiraceae bacterium]|nr:MBOAT family protein [Lachnospiraceae bacterium]
MTFLSVPFVGFLIISLIVYYSIPIKSRWAVLLMESLSFYLYASRDSFWVLIVTVAVSYIASRLLSCLKENEASARRQKVALALSVALIVLPLLVIKEGNFILLSFLNRSKVSLIVPLGISFYTMQIIAYLTDIYRGRITPEKSFLKYTLFVSYFPQIIQGPIPRYEQLAGQLIREHKFDEQSFIGGLQRILWGVFLKLMIADKAGVIVDTIFASPEVYRG